MNQSAEMVKIAAKALEDKKAEDIRVIDIRGSQRLQIFL